MNTDLPSPPRPRCRSLMGVRLVGTGSYVPDGVVTNDHLHARLGFDSDWIVKRTGILNPDDIKTYPLFGDGAGAVLLARGRPDQGILSYSMGADGSGGDLLSRPACGSRLPPSPELIAKGMHFMYMDGRAVFRWAVAILCDTIQDVLDASGLKPSDIDLYIPHQANIRIINAAIDVLRIPRSKVYNNLERYGNTSAGSIPLGIDEAYAEGRIKPGSLIVLS